MKAVKQIEVRVFSTGIALRMEAMQNDTGRQIRCTIADWQIPAGCTARVWMKKPSEKIVYNNCTIDGNAVLVTLTNQALAEAGKLYCMLEIISGPDVVSSFQFIVYVRDSISGNGTESKNESTALEKMFEELSQEAINTLNEANRIITDWNGAVETEKESIRTLSANEQAAMNAISADIKANYGGMATRIDDLQVHTGYTDDAIVGLQVDYQTGTCTRLGGAIGLSPGADFNKFPMFGGRRRCNLADTGKVNAYYGDAAYTETGSNGQVMVEQPKFYYKVVPLKLDPITDGQGYHLRKTNYYLASKPLDGFTVHPDFRNEAGQIVDHMYMSALEGSIYDSSASTYLKADEQIADFTADKLSSIANAKPASGKTQNLTRDNAEKLARNRGNGWHIETAQSISANQLLMMVEYATLNLQQAIGLGVVSAPDTPTTVNNSRVTGGTSSLGNASGTEAGTAGQVSISYRGMENPWGNIWKIVNGVNIWGNGSMKGGVPYICSDFQFAESKNTGNYEPAGFTVSNASGYISAFGYNEAYDWLFLPSETLGGSSSPVGDYLYSSPNLNGFRITLLGGGLVHGVNAGGFCLTPDGTGYHSRVIGARLIYIPQYGDADIHPDSDRDIAKLQRTTASAITKSAKGSHITLTDAAEKGYSKLDIGGMTVQDGTPTPAAPAPLQNVGKLNEASGKYELTVHSSGANLFDWQESTILSAYISGNKIVGSSPTKLAVMRCKKNTTYTIFKSVSERFTIGYTTEYPTISGEVINVTNVSGDMVVSQSGDAEYLCIFYYNGTIDTQTEEEIRQSICVMKGYATESTPYKAHTATISADRPLTRWDKLTCRDGVWGWEYNGGTKTFTGLQEESWNAYGNIGYSIRVNDMKNGNYQNDGYANRFSCVKGTSTAQQGILFGADNQPYVYLFQVNGIAATVAEWKTWLSTHPLTIVYQLATEEWVPLTDSEQSAMNALCSYPGTTYIWTDDPLQPMISVEYTVDTAQYIRETSPTYKDVGRFAITGKATGEMAACTDSVEWPVLDIGLDGKSKQVTTTGAQLIDWPQVTFNYCVPIKEGAIRSNINNIYYAEIITRYLNDYILAHKGQSITLSCKGNPLGKYLSIVIHGTYEDGSTVKEKSVAGNSITFTIPSDTLTVETVSFRFNRNVTNAFTDTTTVITDIMLNAGTTALPYEPYTGTGVSPNPDYPQDVQHVGRLEDGRYRTDVVISTENPLGQDDTPHRHQTIPIFTDEPFYSTGQVSDQLLRIGGKWIQRKRIGILVFNGTENWQWADNDNANYASVYIQKKGTSGVIVPNVNTDNSNEIMFCNYFRYLYQTVPYKFRTIGNVFMGYTDISGFGIITIRKSQFPDVQAFKDFVAQRYNAGDPMYMVYQYATPIDTVLDDATQKALDAAYTYPGTTYAYSTDPLQPVVSVEYVQNSNAILQKLITRITALESAQTQTAAAFGYLPADVQAEMINNETSQLLQEV